MAVEFPNCNRIKVAVDKPPTFSMHSFEFIKFFKTNGLATSRAQCSDWNSDSSDSCHLITKVSIYEIINITVDAVFSIPMVQGNALIRRSA